MIIVWVLSAALSVLFFYGLLQKSKTRSVGTSICVTCVAGLCFVWFPEFATYIANQVGVGRGADLIFYIFIILSLFVMFSLYIRLDKINDALTVLVRNEALVRPFHVHYDQDDA